MSKALLLSLLIFSLLWNAGCNFQSREEKLAKQHCGSCHAYPDPSLLDKETWKEAVLPEMAFRMGLNTQKLFSVPYQDLEKIASVLPKRPMVSEEEWAAIEKYFIEHAPDSLIIPPKPALEPLTRFSVEKLVFPFYPNPSVTALTIDTASGNIYMGDKLGVLYKFDADFNLKAHAQLQSAPSMISAEDGCRLTSLLMGFMEPNDQARGALIGLDKSLDQRFPLLDSLQRPVYFEKADLNNDSLEDYVICAFGNYTGQLLAFEKRGEKWVKHVLSSTSGARKAIVKDVNGDGLEDILVLMTQGNERISLFLNKGDFVFQEKVLLHFPPVYGSSYFEIADFDNDGHFDILYSNGDNADYSLVLKPYHGVKLFLNDGELNFEEGWSYPMHGASQVIVRDFDGDGNLDIAAISYFPDFENHHEESFLYFHNQGNNLFKAEIITEATSGRWMIMEVGDFDQDGDEDILLGAHNMYMNKKLRKQWKEKPTAILVLKNKRNKVAADP